MTLEASSVIFDSLSGSSHSRRLTLETAQEGVREAQANYDRTRDTLQEEIKEAQATDESTQNTIAQQIQEAQANLASITEVRPLDVQKAAAELGQAIAMTLGRAIFVLILTILMCCISGSIALRKLADADPADIF